MRITEADVWETASQVNQRSRNRYGGATRLDRVIVRLRDDAGNEGWGEAMPVSFTEETGAADAVALREAAGKIAGREVEDPAAEVDRLADFGGLKAARTGLETALLDLWARASGRPFSDALGGERRDRFALDGPIGLVSPEEAAEKAKGFLASGISTLKVKAGQDLEADARRLLSLREAFGDRIRLRTDANGGYSADEAIQFTNKILPAGIDHFEQPVLPSGEGCFDVFREIRAMGIPIAVDESLFSLDDAERHIAEDAVDVGVIKIAKFGGPLAAREVARALEAAGKACILSSSYESHIGKSSGLALALSLENCDRAHELGHFAPEEDFIRWRHDISGGVMSRREGTGLGAEGILDRMEAMTVPA